jgi:alpha-beta hydrolase superfamily lysophospholipase
LSSKDAGLKVRNILLDHRTLRFRAFITLGMWLISARDRLFVRIASSSEIDRGTPVTVESSHGRSLQAVVHHATSPQAGILILHGIGDRLVYWAEAQHLLAEESFSSLIVHYAGYGQSIGPITPQNLRADIHAAYAHLRTLLPEHIPVFVLGFSMGTGALADAANLLVPPPAGIILCQPFTSLRAAAARVVSPLFARLMPDLWPTAKTLRLLPAPLLIVHTDADPLLPLAMAKEIEAQAASHSLYPVTLAIPAGLGHDDVYLRPREGYWTPILDFLRQNARPAAEIPDTSAIPG